MTKYEMFLTRCTANKQKRIINSLIVIMILLFSINYSYAYSLSISSPSAILIESKTGKILYQKNMDVQRPMASTSKIMTYLLVMEAVENGSIRLDDKVKVSKNATSAGGTSYNLKENDVLSVNELLSSMMIISANDSALVLAEYIGDTVENFCIKMNDKAKSLGLMSAYFVNPNGMPLKNKDQNKISAKDLAMLTKYTLDRYGDSLLEITSQKQFNGTYKNFSKKNTNELLETTSFIDGLKTGYTDLAGYCLVSTSKVKDSEKNRLIAVVLGGKSKKERSDDSKKIIDFGLNNFYTQEVLEKGEVLSYYQITSDEYIPIEFLAKDTLSILSPKNTDIAKNKEVIFQNFDFNKDILNSGEIQSILRLKDGTETEISLIANRGISVYIDDNPIIFDQAIPMVKDGSTLVPLRLIAEHLGVNIEWDQSNKAIICEKDNIRFKLIVDSKIAIINNKFVTLDIAPQVIQGNAMVPARFIAEALGMEIEWDSDIRAVKIYSV
ncbi:stalk domain-containing protein [Tissierella sp.]|uniref:stalk domain-containing protein n=1 Tax=Tissierella sp. TaxID=41274 RepID=UPI00285C66D8|nr:stalk domain-containing protein [Tissierella sp.]MDR7855471.1 stalk domain-containing protein [Tissierella sp.]